MVSSTELNISFTPHKRHAVLYHQPLDNDENTKLCFAGPLWAESILTDGLLFNGPVTRRVFPRHEFITNHSLCSRLLNGIVHYQEAEMKPSARRLGDVEVRLYSDLHESSNDVISNIPKGNI